MNVSNFGFQKSNFVKSGLFPSLNFTSSVNKWEPGHGCGSPNFSEDECKFTSSRSVCRNRRRARARNDYRRRESTKTIVRPPARPPSVVRGRARINPEAKQSPRRVPNYTVSTQTTSLLLL